MSNYQIIYLNGPSSAGKTTLARALQSVLHDPFLIVGIDQLIYMMPEKLNDWQSDTEAEGFSWLPVKNEDGNIIAYKIHIGPFGKRIVQALKDITLTLAKSGHFLIIDDVSFGKEAINEWKKALKGFNVLWIGVTAPVEIIEKREQERGDRRLGSARWQVERVHKDVVYDLMIDTQKDVNKNVHIVKNLIESKNL